MARKSRKNQNTNLETVTDSVIVEQENKKVRIKCGGYIRLSSDSPETDSSETQLLMIQQYVDAHDDFELIDTYADIGFSGTNFDRPEFTRMMDDVHTGRIQCIIVKDLSRFGRNYLETGYYLETIFPHLNVRLIAINDRFDSSREEDCQGMQIPIKNMVNAMYAMDASKKFTDSFILHSKLGTYKRRSAAYGYILDSENNTLLAEPVASKTVKLIFKWYLMGYSRREIARRLEFADLPIPAEVKHQYENVDNRFEGSPWQGAMITTILKNPNYTGDTVLGRKRHRMYNNDNNRKVDPSEWFVHKNTHVALISHEDFDMVQSKRADVHEAYVSLQEKTAHRREPFHNSFSRMIKCARCGLTMCYDKYAHGDKSRGNFVAHYVCEDSFGNGCGKTVSEDFIKAVVFKQIKVLIKTVCNQKYLAESIKDGTINSGMLLSIQKKISYTQKKLADTEKAIEALYVSLTEEIISAEEYADFRNRYLQEKEALLETLKAQKDERLQLKKRLDRFEDLIHRFEEFIDVQEYNQALVKELVDKVFVGENNEIEIRFKCADVIANFNELLKEEE